MIRRRPYIRRLNFIPYSLILFIVSAGSVFSTAEQEKPVMIQQFPSDPATPAEELRKRPAGILFAGDTHFEWAISDMQKKFSPQYPVESLEDLFLESDFRILNLETTISEKAKPVNAKSYVFKSHPDNAALLNYLNINLAVVGNNHIMDMGEEGLDDTYQNLIKQGIPSSGAGKTQSESQAPYYFKLRGITFAVVSLSTIGAQEYFSYGNKAGVHAFTKNIYATIASAKQNADHVIVSIHWGTEYSPRPDQNQIIIGRRMIDSGATAVIGHHPHIPQGIEYYKNGIIAYSLGNFLFGSINHYQSDNFILKLLFSPQDSSFMGVEIFPLNGNYKKSGHKLTLLKGEAAEPFWKRFYTQSYELNQQKPRIVIHKSHGYGTWLKTVP